MGYCPLRKASLACGKTTANTRGGVPETMST